ncbi:MAG TPA: hypothetical protein VNZ57_02425 [Longimicrobiales bacterium]|nr:hypothetical protein [Longimicrobiales bacterium]
MRPLSITLAGAGIVATAACGAGVDEPVLEQPERVEVVAPGFQLQHVYQIPLEEQGSWVSLAVGPDGDLYASDQGDAGVYRIRIGGDIDNPVVESVTRLPLDVTGFQGLEYAFGALYGHRNSSNAQVAGLYRITDSDNDGDFDTVEYLGITVGGGEHGLHDVLVTEDGQGLYLIGGNSSTPPATLARQTMSGWQEDQLTPRQPDARGHARGRLAPGGFVLRIDPDGSNPTLVSMGYRNEYGGAVNAFGDLFTYDSDLEFDMATPWYRPTRIVHVVSGSDMGWRNGTGKWPEYYEESLPPIANIGPGSPTGVISGLGARFPARYQHAIYALDWTYSTVFAIHLTPSGASYTAEFEEFVAGNSAIDNSFQVTDAEIGADGHMYILTGGRSTPGDLWRVVYRGNQSTEPAEPVDNPEARAAREARRQLEAFHGVQNPAAVDAAWPHLSSPDRFLRHAARVAIESQPLAQWLDRAVNESNPQARITALVAAARVGGPEHREAVMQAILGLPLAQLTAEQKLGALRAFELAFLRLGEPTEAERTEIRQALNALLPDPGNDHRVNTELVRVLVHLRDDQVTAKAVALMRDRPLPAQAPSFYQEQRMRRSGRYGGNPLAIIANPPPSEALGLAWILRHHREGWTEQLRRDYFTFLNTAGEFQGGASYAGHITDMYGEALRNTTPEHRVAVEDLTGRSFVYEPVFTVTQPRGPGRAWTQQEAVQSVQARLAGRSFEAGLNLFFATGCASCHRINEYGSDNGPDLTSLPARNFNAQRVVQALVAPDSEFEDHWAAWEFTLADGRTVVGLPTYTGDRVTIRPRDVRQDAVEVPVSQITSKRRLDESAMPSGLVNGLNEEELADLVAYLQSGGNPDHEVYAQPVASTN